MKSLLIKNGNLMDGSGETAFKADLLITKDRIERIGNLEGVQADKTIDAQGKIVCPGFVDIHSHADLAIAKEDHPLRYEPLIRQGITTFIGGNCGMGVSPFISDSNAKEQEFLIETLTNQDFEQVPTFASIGEFLSTLSHQGIALNAGVLVPHGLIRTGVVGARAVPATNEQVRKMASIVCQSMEEGAFGMSTGLQYFPGLGSTTEELKRLAKELKPFDGRYTSHLRSYTATTLDKAMVEAADIGQENDIQSHISHIFAAPYMGLIHQPFLKVVRKLIKHPNFANKVIPDVIVNGEMQKVMDLFDQFRKKDLRLSMDVMPATTGFTLLLAFFPPWVMEGSKDEVLDRLSDPAIRKAIIKDIETGKPIWPHTDNNTWSMNLLNILGWNCCTVMAVGSKKNQDYEGKNLGDIARERGVHVMDVACDLLIEEEGKVWIFESIGTPGDSFTEKEFYPALIHPETSIVTDTVNMGVGWPSPLFHGCYPLLLGRYVREKKLLSLKDAIRKCTSLSADSLNIKKRGRLKEGYYADVVIFDEKKMDFQVEYKSAQNQPTGIDYVLINGLPVVENGIYHKDARAGQVLRPN